MVLLVWDQRTTYCVSRRSPSALAAGPPGGFRPRRPAWGGGTATHTLRTRLAWSRPPHLDAPFTTSLKVLPAEKPGALLSGMSSASPAAGPGQRSKQATSGGAGRCRAAQRAAGAALRLKPVHSSPLPKQRSPLAAPRQKNAEHTARPPAHRPRPGKRTGAGVAALPRRPDPLLKGAKAGDRHLLACRQGVGRSLDTHT